MTMMLQMPFARARWPLAPFVATGPQPRYRALLAWSGLPVAGSLIIAAAMTYLLSGPRTIFLVASAGSLVDFLAVAAAVFAGQSYLQRVAALPPFVMSTQVLPVMGVTFASVFAIAAIARVAINAVTFGSAFALIIAWYLVLGAIRSRLFRRRVAFVGDRLPEELNSQPGIEWQVLDEPILTEPISAIVVGRAQEIAPEWEHFVGQAVLHGIPVHDSRHMTEVVTGRVQLGHLMENSFGTLLPSLLYVRLKRLADALMALFSLVMVLPVVGLFAVLIKLESPGPAIFCQQRTGYRGRAFTCYKLRSMHCGQAGPAFTLEDDVRITRLGGFIRKFRIDELPQVLNILKGEMSWIGPRPEAVELATAYEAAIPFYVYRHAVRPGVSGWAAVHQGNVGDIDAATIKLQYDLFYIKYCSFWLDAFIVVKTLKTIFTGFGSR